MSETPVRASGVGSWPGEDAREAQRVVRDLLADGHVPYLPELPTRGAGADLIGRTATALVGLPVDLQPSGWRLADTRDRDARRGRSLLRSDLDDLAETYDGYTGPLKVQLAGPLTLAAAVRLPRGERAVCDHGALRDLVQSLTQSARDHLADVARSVPGADIVLQLDEPGLPSVLAGTLPTSSGFGRIPALERQAALEALSAVVRPLADDGTGVVVHCCGAQVPLDLLGRLPGLRVSLDASRLTPAQWERLANSVDADTDARGWSFGIVPTDSGASHPRDHVQRFLADWHRIGLPDAMLHGAVVTPACGLAGATPDRARAITRLSREAAEMLVAE